ncbi:hypothetical protein A3D80_02795 [Candidatus Roizmanbacteria bacterium RIFCSPHIGHO2_02_FULL_40_13b]|nr:MAG: hypothetical protein A3D80_02795 [Candidatus Roizmanbacteria bacterium RIFCSPHIGHO2_02_FULL_40_13b]OGK49278.1 MAG: hypothetical protein A3A56_00625 [Candidatus Roizmanbacteria bacterium RIFCSPLOWO2_01_FULL_40_32]
MENNTRLDPRELTDGEFGDTPSTQRSEIGRKTLYDELLEECARRGMNEEEIRREIEAFIAVCGD